MSQVNVSSAVGYVSDAIVACGAIPLLARFRPESWIDRPEPGAMLACYACFAADAANFGPAERRISGQLGIDRMGDAAWWGDMVKAVCQGEPPEHLVAEAAELQNKLQFAADTLPHVVRCPAPDQPAPGMGLIKILLPSLGDAAPHPLRLATAIQSVCLLWDVACESGGRSAPLTLVACGPPPEISVTFQGQSPQVDAVNLLLMQVWDRVIVCHAATLEDRVAAIPRSLPDMGDTGAVGPAAFDRRRDMEAGIRLFLEAGACTPEMTNPARFTPDRLLQVRPSLQNVSPRERLAGISMHLNSVVSKLQGQPVRGEPIWLGHIRVG